MFDLINLILAVCMLLGGLVMTLIGFNIIKSANKSESDERMIIRRHNYKNFFRIGGIFVILLAVFLLIVPDSGNVSQNWTQAQKDELKQQVIGNSNYLQSINPDTADLVASCFVDKYTSKYKLQECWKQDSTMSEQEILDLTMPMMIECLEMYSLKKP